MKLKIQCVAIEYKISIRELCLMISEICNLSYTDVFFSENFEISDEYASQLLNWIKRRKSGEPLAKILGKKEFYGVEYKTNKNTLDPRPETELIIDLFIKHHPNKSIDIRVLDLGAGTGCIGISLLLLYPNITVDFVDISDEALFVCKENASAYNVFERASFIKSNWFFDISKKNYGAIVSNPPYIKNSFEIDLQTSFDPTIALFAGNDGLDAYKKILPCVGDALLDGGVAIFEIGFDQLHDVLAIERMGMTFVESAKDISGNDRAVVFQASSKQDLLNPQ